MYGCQIGAVMTNSHFTSGAKELAEATGVLLWDREKLKKMLSNVDKKNSEIEKPSIQNTDENNENSPFFKRSNIMRFGKRFRKYVFVATKIKTWIC